MGHGPPGPPCVYAPESTILHNHLQPKASSHKGIKMEQNNFLKKRTRTTGVTITSNWPSKDHRHQNLSSKSSFYFLSCLYRNDFLPTFSHSWDISCMFHCVCLRYSLLTLQWHKLDETYFSISACISKHEINGYNCAHDLPNTGHSWCWCWVA
jgi:hypothetical protein